MAQEQVSKGSDWLQRCRGRRGFGFTPRNCQTPHLSRAECSLNFEERERKDYRQ